MPKRIFYIEFTLKLQYLTLYGTQIGDRGEGGVVLELVNPGGRWGSSSFGIRGGRGVGDKKDVPCFVGVRNFFLE